MNRKPELIRIGLFGIILFTGIAVTYNMTRPVKKLKVYQPADLNPALVDASLQDKTRMHRIADFELLNQKGKRVSQADFEGKIYVTDFFFTTCPGICPKMTDQMKRVYQAYLDNEEVLLLSHTVYPEVDSVPVIAEYARKLNVNDAKWLFVTGDKKMIYDLARKSYFAVTTEGAGDEDDFIHTENFILVDKEKRIRGIYDGTSEAEVNQLIGDMEVLLKEYM